MKKLKVRWSVIRDVGYMLGVASPKYRLNQAVDLGIVEQTGWGKYTINRKRARRKRHARGE